MGSTSPTTQGYDYTTLRRVNTSIFQSLNAEITVSELDSTIENLSLNKAPGPDGFTSEFYKKFKHLMIPDLLEVYKIVLHNEEASLYPLNDSFIVLIPKKTNT
jgi:hypothetical protein